MCGVLLDLRVPPPPPHRGGLPEYHLVEDVWGFLDRKGSRTPWPPAPRRPEFLEKAP